MYLLQVPSSILAFLRQVLLVSHVKFILFYQSESTVFALAGLVRMGRMQTMCTPASNSMVS